MKFTHVCFNTLLIPWVERQSFVIAKTNADNVRAENQLVKQRTFARWRGKKSNSPSWRSQNTPFS